MIASHLLLRRAFTCSCCLICAIIFFVYATENGRRPPRRWTVRPASTHRLYPSNWTLVNLKRFEFLLNTDACNNVPEMELLVLVTSHPGHVDLRQAFRRALPTEALRAFNISRLFMLARINPEQSGYYQVDQSVIEEEHLEHNDIVQGDFIESYHNLSYKHVMGLKYATHFCPQAQFLLKMDDDIAVDLFQLLDLVRELQLSGLQMAGAVMSGKELDPVRDKSSKWYVSRSDYAPSRYPAFVSGWAYVTTIPAARQLVRHAESSPFFWIDDIYVTGMLSTLSGVKHVNIRSRFTVYTDHLRCCLRHNSTACDYLVGPSGDDAELIEAFHRLSLGCHRSTCQSDKAGSSLCVITNQPSTYQLNGRIIHGQVIPLFRK